jgi:hypothetical protein
MLVAAPKAVRLATYTKKSALADAVNKTSVSESVSLHDTAFLKISS